MTRISIAGCTMTALAALTLSAQSVSAGSVNIPTNASKVTVHPPQLNNTVVTSKATEGRGIMGILVGQKTPNIGRKAGGGPPKSLQGIGMGDGSVR